MNKNMLEQRFVGCLLLCGVSIFTFASNKIADGDTLKVHKIDEVMVLGSYKQKTLLENPLQEPVSLKPSIEHVNKINIEKQGAATLIEALKYTPGAWIETRGRKVKQMFSMRGQAYPYPTYSINGIWQKEFQEMSYFFNSANVEEITVNRSSSALLNSLSSLTGVINVKTVQPSSRESRIYGKYGSLNSYNTGVSYADANESINYSVALNSTGTDGIKNMNGKENMWNAMGTFNWNISEKWSLGMNMFYICGKRELALPEEPADKKFLSRLEEYDPYKAAVVSARIKYAASEKFTSEVQLNYADRRPLYKSLNIESNKVTQYKELDKEFTANWINALALTGNNTMRFGMLYNYWIAPEGKRYYYGNKAEVHTVSGVVTDQHSFGKLLFDAGFRLTRQYYVSWGGFSIEGAAGMFSKVNSIKNEWQSPEWQATAGLTYEIGEKSSLHFSYAGGIVTPRKGALTNDGMKPSDETRMNFDLGYSLVLDENSRLSVTAFMVNRANAISYSGKTIELDNGDIMELYKNSDMRNYGIEAVYHSPKFFNSLSFFTNATLMIGEVSDDGEWKKDDELPCFIANCGTNFERANWDINAYLNYVSSYKNDRFVSKDYLKKYGKAPLGDFATMDISVGYRLGNNKNIRFFAEAKNLFDNRFQSVPGYRDYGRVLSAGFDVKF